MRFLILSDIHANWEGLQAVLDRAEGAYEQILCCGDVVGYGADPDLAAEWIRDHAAATVRGNHDKACAGLEDLEWFSPAARASALWTQATMKPENLDYLRALEHGPVRVNGFEMAHGSPLDEDEYVVTEQDVAQIAPYLDAEVTFFGHTHLQGGFLCHRNGVKRIYRTQSEVDEQTIALDIDALYLINPGSVGQPRDGDWRAAYAIYDSVQRLITFFRVPYDVQSAQRKILDAGLPEMLAVRLTRGT